MSGGGGDDAVLAIAHVDTGRLVLDLVIDQGARRHGTFSPEVAVAKFADVLKQYGCYAVTGDNYAKNWPVDAFLKHGITYRPADLNRSQLYAALEPLVNSGQVELLDEPKLIQQLIGLIRKGERIDHGSNSHDDLANAAAGALVLVAHRAVRRPFGFTCDGQTITMDDEDPRPAVVPSPVGTVSVASAASAQDDYARMTLIRQKPIVQRTDEETVWLETYFKNQQREVDPAMRAVLDGSFFPSSNETKRAAPDLARDIAEVTRQFRRLS
jgi:hypothetical protein